MALCGIKPGIPVILRELEPSSAFFKHGQSLRVIGKLESFEIETGIVVISDGGFKLKIDMQHLRDFNFRTGSLYQFIGELKFGHDNDAMLEARIGRNVDGLDLNLYKQSLQIRRKIEANLLSRKRS
ncbi:hypothetical protein LUZ60_003528 [Juncus effusus]|nr:hypothetical protein LUZ60_003528 [Juncus effusus]